jgi:protease IV
MVMDVYGQFVDVVAQERRLPRSSVERVADGRILSGRQALALGLVDRLGNREDALKTVGRMAGLGDDPRTVRPPEERLRLLDILLGRSTADVLSRLVAPLEPAAAVPRLMFVVPR